MPRRKEQNKTPGKNPKQNGHRQPTKCRVQNTSQECSVNFNKEIENVKMEIRNKQAKNSQNEDYLN